jgi:hypothetical protein
MLPARYGRDVDRSDPEDDQIFALGAARDFKRFDYHGPRTHKPSSMFG